MRQGTLEKADLLQVTITVNGIEKCAYADVSACGTPSIFISGDAVYSLAQVSSWSVGCASGKSSFNQCYDMPVGTLVTAGIYTQRQSDNVWFDVDGVEVTDQPTIDELNTLSATAPEVLCTSSSSASGASTYNQCYDIPAGVLVTAGIYTQRQPDLTWFDVDGAEVTAPTVIAELNTAAATAGLSKAAGCVLFSPAVA